MNGSALSIRGLSFRYPDGTAVLDRLDLDVDRGERVALLGPNGAGKTTLLLHLIGILEPASGEIVVGGLPLGEETVGEIRRRVGLVFQDPDDQLFMPTVEEDVAFGPLNLGLDRPDVETRVSTSLARVGMPGTERRVPHHLSGGERRRVAVATVLAMEPELLVLDEPSSNLDPAGRRELAEVLDTLGTTLVLVTHDLPYALQLCERSVILNHGRIVADGPTRELLADGAMMSSNRLELPYGFDPGVANRRTG